MTHTGVETVTAEGQQRYDILARLFPKGGRHDIAKDPERERGRGGKLKKDFISSGKRPGIEIVRPMSKGTRGPETDCPRKGSTSTYLLRKGTK